MIGFMNRAATGFAAALLMTTAIQAQYYAPPAGNPPQAAALPTARTQAYATSVAPVATGYVPPYGYGGYGYTNTTRTEGALYGVAAVTNANGQYQVQIQQARQAQAQADMAKLDVRRRIKQEAEYERMMMPNPEQVRIAEMNASLAHSRVNPPNTDIWSGDALNDFLMFAQSVQRQGLQGPLVPLTEDMLRNINVTTGTTRGSTGALNDGKPLKWPLTLKRSGYRGEREMLDQLVADLVKQAGTSQGPDADTIVDAKKTIEKMESKLRSNIADLTPDEYTSSKRFLTQLSQSVKTMEDPNASNYVSRKWAARGNSVAELVDEMTRNGLKFAPAVSGQEPSYSTLYAAMATYDVGLQRMVGPPPSTVRTTNPAPAPRN